MTGNPRGAAAPSATATTSSPSEMDTTERRRNAMEGRCDSEPEFQRARVGDDVGMCALDEEVTNRRVHHRQQPLHKQPSKQELAL